jgi:hypothetical protein
MQENFLGAARSPNKGRPIVTVLLKFFPTGIQGFSRRPSQRIITSRGEGNSSKIFELLDGRETNSLQSA